MSLSSWERAQDDQAESLRDSLADRDVVVQLLETSCLLEVAKLSPAQLDLADFAHTAVDILSQFHPLPACVLRVEPDGLPSVEATYGTPRADHLARLTRRACDDRPVVDDDAAAFALCVAGRVAGHLAFDGLGASLVGVDFFARVATQLSETLYGVLEAEALRRDAALATAVRVAARIDDRCTIDDIEALARAMADLPGAQAAALTVAAPWLDQPLVAAAGVPSEESSTHEVVGTYEAARDYDLGTAEASEESDPATFGAVIGWMPGGEAGDDTTVDVFDAVHEALSRGARNRALVEEAEVDPLTGIGNRRRAGRALTAALNLAERQGEPVALLALDLDHFKQVNDSLGHGVGDAVLHVFGQLLAGSARDYDVAARIGGEEFVLICPSTPAGGASTVAERIRTAVPEACRGVLPAGWTQTVSVGIAVFPDDAGTASALQARADEALYAAKRAGRDRVAIHERV